MGNVLRGQSAPAPIIVRVGSAYPLPWGNQDGLPAGREAATMRQWIAQWRTTGKWAGGDHMRPRIYGGVLWYPFGWSDLSYGGYARYPSDAYVAAALEVCGSLHNRSARPEGLCIMPPYSPCAAIHQLAKYRVACCLPSGGVAPLWLTHQSWIRLDLDQTISAWRAGCSGPFALWEWAPFAELVGPCTPVAYHGADRLAELAPRPDFVVWNDWLPPEPGRTELAELCMGLRSFRDYPHLAQFFEDLAQCWARLPAHGISGCFVPEADVRAAFRDDSLPGAPWWRVDQLVKDLQWAIDAGSSADELDLIHKWQTVFGPFVDWVRQ